VSEDGKRQNLVHRDVSPQNVFVAYDGHVKLLDFGVALTDERLAKTEAGDVKGKFEYMSPEQANGTPLDRRSDIFAMGIVLYELATGRRLFKRTSHARALEAICKEPVIPPSRLVESFPAALESVIMRALAKRPDDRYATAAEMRKELLEIARVLPAPVESLAAQMQRLFPDRIAEKEELLRLVREGQELPRLPAGEVDEPIRVPEVPEPEPAPFAAAPLTAPAPVLPPPTTSPRALGIALSVVTALLVVAVAAVVVVRRPAPPLPAPAAPDLATSTPVPTPTPTEAPAPAPTAAPASSAVSIHVESRPPGARVTLAGSDRGLTPLDVQVPRGTSPIVLELRSPGFTLLTQSVVPDADQKLLLALQPLRGTRPLTRPSPTTPTAIPKPPPSAAASGFRRFD
jgi:serine/threonine-protein kinase